MPTLEPDLEQIQAMLDENARMISSRIYERQEVAAYWEKQTKVFKALLDHFENHGGEAYTDQNLARHNRDLSGFRELHSNFQEARFANVVCPVVNGFNP